MNHEAVEEVGKELTTLVGVACSRVSGTAGVGSGITLHFGETYFETITLASLGTFRFEEGVQRLALRGADWRLRLGVKVLCSSASLNGPGSEMEIGLRNLLRQTVIAVELEPVVLDLRLVFSNDMSFEIFCNRMEEREGYGNYTFFCPRGSLTVEASSRVSFEPPKASQRDP